MKKITTSYGLILFTVHKSMVYYLIAKRHNSIPYICVVSGRCIDESETERYIRLMPNEERRLLLAHDAETIFRDLYLTEGGRRYFGANRQTAIERYKGVIEQYRSVLNERSLIDVVPWEFPKGRRKVHETASQCAAREFTEETGISDFNMIIHNPLSYQYIGYDGNYYKSVFYLAYTPRRVPVKYKHSESLICKRYVSDEMVDANWMTLRQCDRVRDHKNRRTLHAASKIIKRKLGVV